MRAWLVVLMMAVASSCATAGEIKVVSAGSLRDAFAVLFADFTKQYGGNTFTPVWGASGLLRERLQKGEAFDIYTSAALADAQALTDAGISGPSVLFTRNTLCAVTTATSALATDNFIETLIRPDTRIGTSTPGADPAGDYTWAIFHRVDAERPGAFKSLTEKAQQLVGGRTAKPAVNGRSPFLVALDEHQIDLFIFYCSGAREMVKASPKYKSVELPPDLSVGPEYGLTVSRKAQPGAADFAMYLLSPQGQATLKAYGFLPVALPASP
jgi:molybdate transport system substrate-binding protein